jgi:hypothetical protein
MEQYNSQPLNQLKLSELEDFDLPKYPYNKLM